MKIAIPSEDRELDSLVADTFGRADYFYVWQEETAVGSWLDNSGIAMQGGAGIKAAQLLIDAGVEVLLAPQCGENAAQVLNQAKIKLYQTQYATVEENLSAFLAGKLTREITPHASRH